jgi:hypothetical protein
MGGSFDWAHERRAGLYFAVYFQGFLEPSFAEAAAFCLPVGMGVTGTVSDIWDLVGLRQFAVIRPGVVRLVKERFFAARLCRN